MLRRAALPGEAKPTSKRERVRVRRRPLLRCTLHSPVGVAEVGVLAHRVGGDGGVEGEAGHGFGLVASGTGPPAPPAIGLGRLDVHAAEEAQAGVSAELQRQSESETLVSQIRFRIISAARPDRAC